MLQDDSGSFKDKVGKSSPAFENILITFSKSIGNSSNTNSVDGDESGQFKAPLSQYGPLCMTGIAVLFIV